MELEVILDRFAEGINHIDSSTRYIGRDKKGNPFLPGVPSLPETKLCDELVEWWRSYHPDDFEPVGTCLREVPYPNLRRLKCDIVFSSKGHQDDLPEWAIEVKRIQFVGDNGGKNDHGVQKVLSPYLKDRSLVHDIHRMRLNPIAKHHAVIGYAFSYSFDSCNEARQIHPDQMERISKIERDVCRSNNQDTGEIDPLDLVDIADVQFQRLGLVVRLDRRQFSGLWRHPCGGNGVIFAWEVSPHEVAQEPRQDCPGN